MCVSTGTANILDPGGALVTALVPKQLAPLKALTGFGGTVQYYKQQTTPATPNAPIQPTPAVSSTSVTQSPLTVPTNGDTSGLNIPG